MAVSDRLVLSYYGDDFTGSTDVMEALTFAGVRTVLFLAPPEAGQIGRFEGVEAVGVAGRTRSMSPSEMGDELLPVYRRFRELGTPVVHYKTCSTFDSSPEIGSIGRAIDLGQEAFGSSFVPLVVGAPILRRYCLFGNLFARSGLESEVYRLDRHPTMRYHPITPMEESDLRLHLERQTEKGIGLFDILQLSAPEEEVERRFEALLASGPEVVLFDTLCEADLPKIGRTIWQRASRGAPLFVAGSSGVEYALTGHWRKEGLIPDSLPVPKAKAVSQLAVVSGSCSPVTDRQIGRAVAQGFAEIPLDTVRLATPEEADGEIQRGVQEALAVLGAGRSVVLHTGRGPEDPRIGLTADRLRARGFEAEDLGLRSATILGEALGRILRTVLEETGLPRAATTGGDTSFYMARSLGIEALEVVAPMAPGSPLCRIHTQGTRLHGREIVFKGGQVGTDDFFDRVLKGKG